MEDVVLHYQHGSAAGLGSLLERTEKLLESFPCRAPVVFTPWFPTTADIHLPIRPAKPAPVITCLGPDSDSRAHAAQTKPQEHEDDAERSYEGAETSSTPKDDVSETSNRLLFNKPQRQITSLSPDKHKHGLHVSDSPVKRSWSVFTQKRVLLQGSQSLSRHFHHVVSVHQLHLRQRVKWVIGRHNWGANRDIEQVWQTVSRSVWSSKLPTCNANIQRERAEIWVFCDVLHSEQVGRFLKDELQLSGRISLLVHRLGNIFSM